METAQENPEWKHFHVALRHTNLFLFQLWLKFIVLSLYGMSILGQEDQNNISAAVFQTWSLM